MTLNRVVVTGAGVVAAGIRDAESFWRKLLSGVSAIGPITAPGREMSGCRLAAEIESIDQWPLGISRRQQRYLDPVSVFGLMAARAGLEDAGVEASPDQEADDIGFSIGISFGSLSANRYENRFSVALAAVTSYFGSIIGNITIPLRLSGPSHTFMSFDVAGTDAIGYAFEVIRHGKARAMLAGGVDSPLNPLTLEQLDRAELLSHGDHLPEVKCHSANGDSSGVVLGEGGAVLVLESLESAIAAGHAIYAEILGYNTSADGDGSIGMRELLNRSGVTPGEVDCVVMSGTGNSTVDSREVDAIQHVFGRERLPAVTHLTWCVGHTFAGHGAIQAAASSMILREQSVPPAGPSRPSNGPSECCGLHHVKAQESGRPLRSVLQNTFGLCGQNSFLLFGKYE